MERAWDLLESDLQERLKTIDVYFSTHRFEGDSPLEPLKVSTGTYQRFAPTQTPTATLCTLAQLSLITLKALM